MDKPTIKNRLINAFVGSIRTMIWLSVGLCLVAVGIVATSNMRTMEDTAALPRLLFEKPYKVGLAVRDLKADVIVMHAELSDLASSPSRLALRRFQQRMVEIDARVEQLQSTISNRFVGDQQLAIDAFASHRAWNAVREQVVEAIRMGDQVTAYTLMKTEGYNQLKYLDENLDRLIAAASEHSHRLHDEAGVLVSAAWRRGMIAVAVAVLILGLAVLMINAIIVRPVREISSAMQSVSSGNLETKIPHSRRSDEIGLIARSCRVFLNHAISIQESSIDLLTGLPKRHQLLGHISVTEQKPKPEDRTSFVLHLDIDGFTEVNDGLGRDVGDRLLVFVAEKLRSIKRQQDFIAREGADSFVLYCSNGNGADEAVQIAERIQALLEEPMEAEDTRTSAQCSIGIVVSNGEIPAEILLNRAENALIDSQRQANRSISIYTAEMDARLLRRRETLRGLRFALTQDEIVPFFQPQVDARTGELTGFECLVRWADPEQGLIAPWQFLPVAKSAGLMSNITDAMISQSLGQLAEWRAQGFDVPRVSLNLDATDLGRDGFADRLMLEIDKHGLAPDDVCLELLESAMIEDGENPVSKTLNRLGQIGFLIELDDFGTGHAAIASLRLIALNGIKIDRSFVTKLHERPGQMKLTRAMLRLAHALQIQTVAEGVETRNERDLLLELGCDVIQGFGVGKPMSADEATLWLTAFSPSIGRMDDVRHVA